MENAIPLLRCLSSAGAPLGVTAIVVRHGIHKSSVSCLAATLERARIIERDPASGRLTLGVGLVALAAPVMAGLEMLDLARPLLVALVAETKETMSFDVWDGEDAVSAEQAPGSNSVRVFSNPGYRNPGHATAAGKALLAHMGESAITAYCALELDRFTEETIADPSVLAAELARCPAEGYAINVGELASDIGAVPAIVFDRRGVVSGSVAVAVPMYRFGPGLRSELAVAVRRCTAELSTQLSYDGSLTRNARSNADAGGLQERVRRTPGSNR